MQPNIDIKIQELEQRVDELSQYVRRLKFYIKWFIIVSVVLFVAPLVGLMFVIPSYIDTLNTITSF